MNVFIHKLLCVVCSQKRVASFAFRVMISSHTCDALRFDWKIRPWLIAKCFGFFFHYNLTTDEIEKLRVSAYSRDWLKGK